MTGIQRSPLLVFALMALATQLPAVEPPERLSYQGVLRSAAGAPLDGTYDMVFRFTDAPAGGTLLLTDYHTGPNAIEVDGGLFTAVLGAGTLAPGTEASLIDIFSGYAPVYLEVQVGAETLAPRVEILSTAFALNAGRFGGQLPDGYLDVSPAGQVKEGTLTSNGGLIGQPTATSGEVRGVKGTTVSSGGIGVLGSALATVGPTEGVRGQSTSTEGIGVVGGAFAASGATIGVYGESQSADGTAVQGRATAGSGGTVGVGGENFSTLGTGVAGVAHATSGEAWGVYGETSSPEGYGVVSVGDFIAAGDIYSTGTKYFLEEHPDQPDRAIRFACLEGGETGVYHRGSGRLVDGESRVRLRAPFPLVAAGSITVQVTPSEDVGALYVPVDSIDATGFTVREAADGRSNAGFSYLVLAERAGYEGREVVRPVSLTEKIATSRRLTPGQKRTLRSSLATVRATGEITAEEREALYSALHAGKVDDACGLLGGCRAVGAADDGSSTAEPPAPTVEATPAATVGLNRLAGRVAAAGSLDPTAPRVPPSSLAVSYSVSDTVTAADVLVLDELSPGALRVGRDAYDRRVVGVVAATEDPVPAGQPALVAVAGAVPCHVDADYGWISPGDLLVVSPTPGHAMRADDPDSGTVIGKALESLEAGRGTIRILLLPR